jgi:isoquinoline 1-oxidoreductase alpha subunit
MAAAALLKRNPKPTDADIDNAMSNICRCGSYQKIRDGIHVASGQKTLVEVLAKYQASPATRA